MDIIQSLDQLDERLAACDAAASDAELRRIFSTFRMEPEPSDLDPFCDAYLAEQMKLYKRIAGKDYSFLNEVSTFDVEAAVRRPFPFITQNAEVTGNQLLAIGSLLRRLDVPVGGRILEFGPGWGNTTLAMAMCGFSVTAVDIEKNFCELIQRRAEQHSVSIEVVHGDFMWAESVEEPYDAAVFFECFHHCADHMRLLRALGSAVKPEGAIYFAGEPIDTSFPMPWGLRMDGESLWAIRKNGWLELGFRDDYFSRALRSLGWDAIKHASGDHFGANVWEAKRVNRFSVSIPADTRMLTIVGVQDARGITVETASDGWAFYGPYVRVPAGQWVATATFDSEYRPVGRGMVDVCHGADVKRVAAMEIDFAHMGVSSIELAFELDEAVTQLQMRFLCIEGVSFRLKHFELRAASGLRS
ncbi:2-polyprenyl-3-methyl-5-hydroxy-6-metoxy-1,4-benzoquinol methylase [Variovorax sp. HW608]|uniref:class I SAM-dependent methyltransferase n=1 Tax=Variovorax sp. HW608 TaxID=1034889 RepID=UPI00081F883F|nr:class I SAM-dependent methyltransferase [Variovorax sp. HW608]SCK31571.1 2-polyprenyl-3-methyl-5-hydroxy-6-metoxy-1,4-benzoquinol methylase [Variovorax sp. HW608]